MRGMASRCIGIRPRKENARIRDGHYRGRSDMDIARMHEIVAETAAGIASPTRPPLVYGGAHASPPGGGKGRGRGCLAGRRPAG